MVHGKPKGTLKAALAEMNGKNQNGKNQNVLALLLFSKERQGMDSKQKCIRHERI